MVAADTIAVPGWIEACGLPAGVRGGCATRLFEGVSAAPYGPANYGDRSGDDLDAVSRNRALLRQRLALPAEPIWLRQVHGRAVHVIDAAAAHAQGGEPPEADACIIRGQSAVAVVQTADCLPILLAARDQPLVAAVHAGWRGLAGGVIESTLTQLQHDPGQVHAWLGPAIGQQAFEVGPEVRRAFVDQHFQAVECFSRGHGDRWHADLYALARLRLQAAGIESIRGGNWCTHSNARSFHSFRRDGASSGRMASLIWRL
ncbi:MAG: peptidoglycan editing factor PgeF [Lysobacterales bacterium]